MTKFYETITEKRRHYKSRKKHDEWVSQKPSKSAVRQSERDLKKFKKI